MTPKNITIQVWTDLYYCRVIGIWRPHEEDGAIPQTAPMEDPLNPKPVNEYSESSKINLPKYIVLSSVYQPRSEVMGNNPVAPGQHPIPKEFIDDQTRQISYMFANEMGIFTPPTKQISQTFLAKQTLGYKMIKEIKREVTPAQGSMTLKDLRDHLGQFTDEELESMPMLVLGENQKDADKRGLEKYLYSDKQSDEVVTDEPIQLQYLTMTKIHPVYELEDPYIKKSPITEDHAEKSLPPGTEEEPMVQEGMEQVEDMVAEDDMNRDALEVYDEMMTPKEEIVTDEDGEPVIDERTGEPKTEMVEPSEPDRIAVLEDLLKKKNQQLIDAGVVEPSIKKDKELIPEPAKPMYSTNPEDLQQ